MKKVLFIAPEFPPQAGPGVHRSLNFANFLQDHGYETIIITQKVSNLDTKIDNLLLNRLTENITIYRLDGIYLKKTIRFLMSMRIYRFFWFLFYPLLWEPTVPWSLSTIKEIEKIIRLENIKLVYTSSGPFSSLITGRALQKKCNIKWVADLRDPFTDAYAWQFPTKIHWYLMRYWEKRILSKPDKLIVNTNTTRELFLKRKISNPQKMVVITNGY